MIIDAHVHIHPNPKGFGELYDASLNNLLKQMKKVPVDKLILLPIAPIIPNSFIAEACNKKPDKLLGLASVDPKKGKRALEIFEHDVLTYGLKGLKIHPRIQGLTPADLKNLVELVKVSTKMNLPIVIDAFFYGKNMFKTKCLELINQIALEVPKAKIIIGHAGAYKIFDAMMIAKAHKKIYLDLSFSLLYFRGSSIIEDLGFVIKKVGPQKFIYGSDFPQCELGASLIEADEFLDKIKLHAREKENILGKNAKRIFRI